MPLAPLVDVGLPTAVELESPVAPVLVDEVCDVLVEQRGWSFDDYEAWLTDALATLLLR